MRRVLAVDDAPEIRRVVERALVNAGYQVFVAENGAQAIAAARSMPFDIAVVDYDMPPPNGLDVLCAIRKFHPGCVSILASGSLDVPLVTRAVNSGDISRILPKPFDSDALICAIRDALKARREVTRDFLSRMREERENERKELDDCLVNHLELAIQPFVNVAGRKVVAYEALLRSGHRTLGGPLEVIGAAERHGQVGRLADAVFELANRRLDKLNDDLKLFINLHPQELHEPALLADRLGQLARHRERVVFEITERSDLGDADGWQSSLELMRSAGFEIAVDDLGAGYSSLSVLAAIKPQYMKVDMSIIRGVDRDEHKRQLLELLAQFAWATRAQLVAEGVETEAEASAVTECGAHLMQGYLFGRPRV